jgi:hypothetical protein
MARQNLFGKYLMPWQGKHVWKIFLMPWHGKHFSKYIYAMARLGKDYFL